MIFFHALGGIFSLLLVVVLGYFLARSGWFSLSTRKLLPKLVTNVSLPPFLACTIITSFERGSLLHMLYGAVLPMLTMVIMFVAGYVVAKLLGVNRRHFGLFCASVSNPNTIFIGIPVNLALFGHESLPYVLLYYFASTLFFWTVGNYFISRDESNTPKSDSAFHWQKIISPPLYGFLCGLVLVCLDWHLPDFVFQAARITGDMTTPLALIFIGITLQCMDLRHARIGRDVIVALAGRMIASPLLMWLLLPVFALPELMGKVFVIQSSLPVLMQVAILSAYYDTDPEYGSLMVSLSTILCSLTIPLYMVVLG